MHSNATKIAVPLLSVAAAFHPTPLFRPPFRTNIIIYTSRKLSIYFYICTVVISIFFYNLPKFY